MSTLRGNGDLIAAEFARLLGSSKKDLNPKVAQDLSVENKADDKPEDKSKAVDNAEDSIMDKINDAIVTEETQHTDLALDALADDIDSLSAYSKEHHILRGLDKIAASLRRKGEGFAADVVLATAKDISGDLKKEAGRKKYIVNSLNKIATELSHKGDRFASDLVKATINKIR
jgi:predicted Zn-ribbon and HTH transcriptional regulator